MPTISMLSVRRMRAFAHTLVSHHGLSHSHADALALRIFTERAEQIKTLDMPALMQLVGKDGPYATALQEACQQMREENRCREEARQQALQEAFLLQAWLPRRRTPLTCIKVRRAA